jgi:hypothetical protein
MSVARRSVVKSLFGSVALAAPAMLPGCAIAPAAAAVRRSAPYVPGAESPDHDLIEVCGFVGRLHLDYEARCVLDEDDPDLNALAEIEREGMEWIRRHPALTLDGLSAKAEAMRLHLPKDGQGNFSALYSSPAEAAAWSLADDIARLAGAQ